ncbi:MAG: VCBS repeat-containing protein [Thermoplasmatales archaeon]|nr:VCBS repeat-containing protein [Thermoplasmatales archaeon]
MKKYLLSKTLVIGIIILFFGASVLPSISGNIQSTNTFSNGSGIIPSVDRANEVESEANPVEPLDLINPFFDIYEVIDFGQTAWGMTSADFNDDGDIDFAVSSATSPFTQSTISIFYNDGNLEFTQDDVFTFYYSYISDLDSGDYDLDGDIDLMFTYSEKSGAIKTNGIVNILYNDGVNNFNDYTMVARHLPAGGEKRINPQITSADFDMDDDLDFLVGDNSGKVEIYLNNGSGNFTSAGFINDWGKVSWGLTSADFDGDGDIDFLVAAHDNPGTGIGYIYLKRNQLIESNHTIIFEQGPGELISETPFLIITVSLISLDYNNDGAMDFVTGGGSETYIYINRNGSFEQFFICRLPPSPEGNAEDLKEGAMTSADYDNDGYTDLITGGDQGTVRLLINRHTLAVITRPKRTYLYMFDEEKFPIFPYNGVLIIGKFTVGVKELVELEKVEFYVDRGLQETVTAPPYNFSWTWKPILLFRIRHTLKIVAYDSDGNHTEHERKVLRFI